MVYAVDCVICKQVLYEDIYHLGRAFKVVFDADKSIVSNFCKTCFNCSKNEGHIKDKHRVFNFNCNEDHCKFLCKKSNVDNRPFWQLDKSNDIV
jgi:hypothetical protein